MKKDRGMHICSICNFEYSNPEDVRLCLIAGEAIAHLKKIYQPDRFLLLEKRVIYPIKTVDIRKGESCLACDIIIPRLDNNFCKAIYPEIHRPGYWLTAEAISVTDAVLKYGWRVSGEIGRQKWEEGASEIMKAGYLGAIKKVVQTMAPEEKKFALLEYAAFLKPEQTKGKI